MFDFLRCSFDSAIYLTYLQIAHVRSCLTQPVPYPRTVSLIGRNTNESLIVVLRQRLSR